MAPNEEVAWHSPATLVSFVYMQHYIMKAALHIAGHATNEHLANAEHTTGHSMRVTIPNALAHHGENELTIKFQGQWQSTAMVAKYTRNRRDLAIASVRRLAADLRARNKIERVAAREASDSESSSPSPSSDEGAMGDSAMKYEHDVRAEFQQRAAIFARRT